MTNAIRMFFHCRRCIEELPEGVSPREYARLEAGSGRSQLPRYVLNPSHTETTVYEHRPKEEAPQRALDEF